jgi:hypothetical protein
LEFLSPRLLCQVGMCKKKQCASLPLSLCVFLSRPIERAKGYSITMRSGRSDWQFARAFTLCLTHERARIGCNSKFTPPGYSRSRAAPPRLIPRAAPKTHGPRSENWSTWVLVAHKILWRTRFCPRAALSPFVEERPAEPIPAFTLGRVKND